MVAPGQSGAEQLLLSTVRFCFLAKGACIPESDVLKQTRVDNPQHPLHALLLNMTRRGVQKLEPGALAVADGIHSRAACTTVGCISQQRMACTESTTGNIQQHNRCK